ncbi:hypothetical protein HGB07_06040 [Candidatus Roizmanbacteria bacterium]|nr:hypothetical protein [Candidatus Roizmanbacteria bacterium]
MNDIGAIFPIKSEYFFEFKLFVFIREERRKAMPTVQRPGVYTAIFNAARTIFARPGALDPYFITRSEGEPLYRYVEYYNTQPQMEAAVRTIFTPLAGDTNNRWTGSDGAGHGSQGLYLSGEFIIEGQPFPELEYYQNIQPLSPPQDIDFFRYEAGHNPIWQSNPSRQLRTMFLFNQTRGLSGINFSLPMDVADHPLLTEILEQAQHDNPEAFQAGDTLRNLYMSPDDASFTRAIGNAIFDNGSVEFFQTTSVRDAASSNIILRPTQHTAGGQPQVDDLQAQGRTTFLLDDNGHTTGCYTIDDLIYNSRFEQAALGNIPPREVFANFITPYETTIQSIVTDNVDWDDTIERIDHFIDTNISQKLEEMGNPFVTDQGIDDLIDNLVASDLSISIFRELSTSVLSSLAQSPVLLDLICNIGVGGVHSIVDALIVVPRYERLVNPLLHQPSSYLEAVVRRTVLERKKHWFNENQARIQQALAEVDTAATATREELDRKQTELTIIEQQLQQNPKSSDIQEQKRQIEEDIQKLVDQQSHIEEQREETEAQRQEVERNADDTTAEIATNEQEARYIRTNMFDGV